MHVPTIIERKRDGYALDEGEIRFLVSSFTDGVTPDYQMSAFAMAVFFQGMDAGETAALTRAMLESGASFRWPEHAPRVVDKHSTGGVGDKVSLVLAPLLACDDLWVPMISGRGLGITGGTLEISGTGDINSSSGITVNGGNFRYNSSTNLAVPLTFTSGTLSGTNLTGASFGTQVIGTGKIISPGNSPGTMNVASQTWASGGAYLFEINDVAGAAGADPGWDLLSGTGTLDITATSISTFTINLTSLTTLNTAGAVTGFNDTTNYFWMLADFANPVGGFDANKFTVNTSGFSNTFSGDFAVALGGTGVVPGDNTRLYLTYTAIPEPSTMILGGLGLLALLRRRR